MLRDVASFQRRLAASLRAGIAAPQALGIASDGLSEPLRGAVERAARRVRAGSALAPALGAERALGDVEVAVVAAGEEAGLLPENLDRLASWSERELSDWRKLALGLLYP